MEKDNMVDVTSLTSSVDPVRYHWNFKRPPPRQLGFIRIKTLQGRTPFVHLIRFFLVNRNGSEYFTLPFRNQVLKELNIKNKIEKTYRNKPIIKLIFNRENCVEFLIRSKLWSKINTNIDICNIYFTINKVSYKKVIWNYNHTYRSDCKRKIDIKDISTFSSIINIFSYRDCKTLDTLSISGFTGDTRL